MADLSRYRPSIGVLRALAGDAGEDAIDIFRARGRGLIDRDGRPNREGREVLRREIARSQRKPRSAYHG